MPTDCERILSRDKEDEQKIARCGHSHIERFFVKSDAVAGQKTPQDVGMLMNSLANAHSMAICLRISLFLLIAILSMAATVQTSHYYDSDGSSLEQFDTVWSELYPFFGDRLPEHITVKYRCSGGLSSFSSDDFSISIDPGADGPHKRAIAHESSHIALSRMTVGASKTENFRFLDEGFAVVMGYLGAGEQLQKGPIISAAWGEKQKDPISLGKLEQWSNYFGDWQGSSTKKGKLRFEAYDVSASFILYTIDALGMDRLKAFFIDIGNTKDLATSIKNIFGKELSDVEAEWLAYIDSQYARIKSNIPPQPPQIASMNPPNDSDDVDPATDEISILFDGPMGKEICVITDCTDICFKNASWMGDRTLVIKLPGKLRKNRIYSIGLGDTQKQCLFQSASGTPLPPTVWQFKTKK